MGRAAPGSPAAPDRLSTAYPLTLPTFLLSSLPFFCRAYERGADVRTACRMRAARSTATCVLRAPGKCTASRHIPRPRLHSHLHPRGYFGSRGLPAVRYVARIGYLWQLDIIGPRHAEGEAPAPLRAC